CGYGSHSHELLMELLGRMRCALLPTVRLPQFDDRILAQVVGDRLGRPFRIAVQGSLSSITDGAGVWIRPRLGACPGQERNVLGEIVYRCVKCHPTGMNADIYPDSHRTEQLDLE